MPERFTVHEYNDKNGGGLGIYDAQTNSLAPFGTANMQLGSALGELRAGRREWSTLSKWTLEEMQRMDLIHWPMGAGDQQQAPPLKPGKFGLMSGDDA